jgi:undecaprenyl-diphosphatase
LLILATLPVVVLGLLFRNAIERAFDTPYVTGFMLLLTGVLLYSTRWGETQSHDEPKGRHALAMGVTQCLALLPGVSRSGSTIAAGLWTGLKGERAAEFSFLMSLPAITGAAVLQLADIRTATLDGPLLTGFVVALLAGVAAIKSLVWLVRRQGFHLFAWYVWAVGLLFLGYLYLA